VFRVKAHAKRIRLHTLYKRTHTHTSPCLDYQHAVNSSRVSVLVGRTVLPGADANNVIVTWSPTRRQQTRPDTSVATTCWDHQPQKTGPPLLHVWLSLCFAVSERVAYLITDIHLVIRRKQVRDRKPASAIYLLYSYHIHHLICETWSKGLAAHRKCSIARRNGLKLSVSSRRTQNPIQNPSFQTWTSHAQLGLLRRRVKLLSRLSVHGHGTAATIFNLPKQNQKPKTTVMTHFPASMWQATAATNPTGTMSSLQVVLT
jgi:hypothetical protein